MKLEQGKISWYQYSLILFAFAHSIAYIAIPTQGVKNLTWLVVLASTLHGLFYIYIFVTLALMLPGKTFFEINDLIFGPYVGKFISASYLWFFMLSTALNLWVFGSFFNLFYPKTPIIVINIMTILVCAMGVRGGLEVISRCAQLLVPLVLIIISFTTVLLFKDINIGNLLPLTGVPLKTLLRSVFAVTPFIFGEAILFVMIIPYLNQIKEVKKTVIPVVLIGLYVAFMAARNTAVLGITGEIFIFPGYETLKSIHVGEILTRLEILVAINFLFMGFFRITLFYYGLVLGTAQLLKLRSYHPLVLPFGVIVTCLSMMVFENIYEDFNFAFNYFPIYSFPFQVGIPLLALIVARLRGLHKKEK